MSENNYKNPYPGLRPFNQEENKFFFGRDEHINQLIQRLKFYRFVSVIGQSGCGKSSLVSAGLIPTLKLKKRGLGNSETKWLIAQLRPEISPIHNLAQAIFSTYQYNNIIKDYEIQLIKSDLKAGGLIDFLNAQPLPDNTNLLLFIDQFEEIFRYGKQYNIEEATQFVNLLIESSKQEIFPVYIVITMRSSFIGNCSIFSGLPEIFNNCLFLTPRLTIEQLNSVIVKPAKYYNIDVDPKLVRNLINDMGKDQAQLPIMQHVLMRIWNNKDKKQKFELNYTDYERMGDLFKALSKHADDALNELSQEQQIIAENLFCCLCEQLPNDTVTRRPVKLSEIVNITKFNSKQLKPVIKAFSEPGLGFITTSDSKITEKSIIDITHESLISNWTQLSKWVEKEFALAEQYRRIETTASLWKKEQAGLLTGLDLEFALKWKKENKSEAWAGQYGNHYGWSKEFLEASEKKKQIDTYNRKKEALQKQKQARNKIIMKSVIVGLIITILFALWGGYERRKTTITLFESKLTHAALNAQIGHYYNAKNLLNQTQTISNSISNDRLTVRNLISWYVNLMCSTPEHTFHFQKPIKDFSISPDGNNFVFLKKDTTLQNCIFHNATSNPVCYSPNTSVSKIYCSNNGFFSVGDYISFQDFSGNSIFRQLIRNSSKYLSSPSLQKVEVKQSPLFLAMDVSSDEKLIAVGNENITIYSLLKLNANSISLTELNTFLSVDINCLTFSPKGKFLASGLDDGQIIIWNIETGEQNRMFKENTDSIVDLSFHPDLNILASVDSSDRIIVWDIFSGRPNKIELSSAIIEIKNIRFDQTGNYLYVAGLDRNILLIDANSGVTIKEYQGHNAGVSSIQIRDRNLYSASLDCSIKKWDINTDKIFSIYSLDITKEKIGRQQLIDHISDPIDITSIDISNEGQYIAYGFTLSSTKKHGIGVYSLIYKSEIWKNTDAHANKINRVVFSPDGKFLASASHDKTLKIYFAGNKNLIKVIKENDNGSRNVKTKGISGCVFSKDSQFVISSHYNGRIGVFGINNETSKYYLEHKSGVNSIFWNSSGNRLYSIGEDGNIVIWSWNADPKHLLKKEKEYQLTNNPIRWATISPDDSKIAFMGEDQKIHIVRNNSFENIPSIYDLEGHERDVVSGAFTPNSHQLISISKDSTIRFWDLSENGGSELINLRLPIKSYYRTALWDFDFSCFPSEQSQTRYRCIITAPLSDGRFAMYTMDNVY